MTDLRTAAQQALEALDSVEGKLWRPWSTYAARAADALKAALAQQAKPVAWNWMLDGQPYGQAYYGNPPDTDIAERAATAGRTVRLLYTAPPQRKPLTDATLWGMWVDSPSDVLRFARAVERAHGIKE